MSSDKMFDHENSFASFSCNALLQSDEGACEENDRHQASHLGRKYAFGAPFFEIGEVDPEHAAPEYVDHCPNPQQETGADASVSDKSSTSGTVDGEAVDEPPYGSSHPESQRKRKRRNPQTESKIDANAAKNPPVLDMDVLIGYSGKRKTSGQLAWQEICNKVGRKTLDENAVKSLLDEHRQVLLDEPQRYNRNPVFLVECKSGNIPPTAFKWTRPCKNYEKIDYWVPATLQQIIQYVAGRKLPKSACADTHNVAPPHDDPAVRQLQHSFDAQLNVSVPFGMGHPHFRQIMKTISDCKNVEDCEFAYLHPLFEACLRRITKSQQHYFHNDHSNHLMAWAEDWAERLKLEEPFAESLNADRKVCLALLYKLCNLWKPKDPATSPTVSEADIVNVFKDTRVKRILYCCLVMDRANALYNMSDSNRNLVGMHWYSHKDMETVTEWRALYGEDRANEPTINKRLTWLFEVEGLGLQKEGFLKALMEPCRTPLAFGAVSTWA